MIAEPKQSGSHVARGYALAIVVTHFALSVAHGAAHAHLAIRLTAMQQIFIIAVITAAPLLAGYLIWKFRLRVGGLVLALSMAGALAFGIYYHYVVPGPDNVSYDHSNASPNWRSLFENTSMDLALVEGLGVFAGLALILKASGHAGAPDAATK